MKGCIGKRIKDLRKKNQMTQEQLAEAVDVDISYISKIENNHVRNISLSLACELAAVLQVSLSYLVGEEMSRKYEACTDEQKRILLKIADILHESK